MGPLTLGQLKEKLLPSPNERRLAVLDQLWSAFGIHHAFLDTTGASGFTATVVSDAGVGTLKEANGMLSLQVTLYREITGTGVKERPDSSQLLLTVGDKELHLAWPGSLSDMLADPTFRWIVERAQGATGAG
jgi:hypothetical protein